MGHLLTGRTARESDRAAEPAAHPVGSAACAGCHTDAYRRWQDSQHAHAMQIANSQAALGDFSGAKFSDGGVDWTFFQRDGRLFTHAEGPQGANADFEIDYTFGVDPLQQYLVRLPGGRLQALTVAWDSRPRTGGGQRWFSLYPDELLRPDDRLHWTGIDQNWDHMCADCHSTGVRKNYDATTSVFDTTWSEIVVGCEACHGPGSRHLAWAAKPDGDSRKGLTVALNERRGIAWLPDALSGNATRSAPRTSEREIGVCAQCHARRSQIAPGYVPGAAFLDFYAPDLLTEPLYHVDGQQYEEVYTWGSFLQSRMYARGVSCSDCHEPHSQKLRAEGNAVCAGCHAPRKYDNPAHHFHAAGTPASQCVSCHMPATTYMQIDPRHDHSLRVPRPDRTMTLGTPNACNACHADRPPSWADATLVRWLGRRPGGFQQFAEAFARARGNPARAPEELASIARDRAQPTIVRATALEVLAPARSDAAEQVILEAVRDEKALVRWRATAALETLPPERALAAGGALLEDPVRVVRIEAARVLAPLARTFPELIAPQDLQQATDELRASLRFNADRPEARVALATFEGDLGNFAAAEEEFVAALRIDRAYVPAYVNQAEMQRLLGREDLAEQILRDGLAVADRSAPLHHALGLTLIRLQQQHAGVGELGAATRFDPKNARYAYVYAVGLNAIGNSSGAIREVERALRLAPEDRDLLRAAALFHRDQRDLPGALRFAKRWAEAYPQDAEARALVEELTMRLRE
ncbi:MAG: multiheme c-type cytochrome [Steroidobacteraceae bacterium]